VRAGGSAGDDVMRTGAVDTREHPLWLLHVFGPLICRPLYAIKYVSFTASYIWSPRGPYVSDVFRLAALKITLNSHNTSHNWTSAI
jgi:hypothetical protein